MLALLTLIALLGAARGVWRFWRWCQRLPRRNADFNLL
jgi:hypothetical protein